METERRSEHEAFGVLENEAKMTCCKGCGHKLGFLECAADGLSNGCRQRLLHDEALKTHSAAMAPYIGAELPVIAVTDAIMKKDCALLNGDGAQGD